MGATILDTEPRLLRAIRLKGRLSKDAAATIGSGSNYLMERFVAVDLMTVSSPQSNLLKPDENL
jgi:hypothetical protein